MNKVQREWVGVLATGSTKTKKVINSFTFFPFVIDVILSFLYKEKERLGGFKTLDQKIIPLMWVGWSLQRRHKRLKISYKVNKF